MSYFVGLGTRCGDRTIERVVGDSPAAVFAQAGAQSLTIGLVYQFPDRDRPGRPLLRYGPSVSLPGHMVVWHQLLGWFERLCGLWREGVLCDRRWARERAAGRALAQGMAYQGARPFPDLAEWVSRFGHGTVSLLCVRVSTRHVFADSSAFAARWLWPAVIDADANPLRESGEEPMSAANRLNTDAPVGSLPREIRRTRMARCSDDPIENWILVNDAVESEWERWCAMQAATAVHPPGNGTADPWECELFRDEGYSVHPAMEAIGELAAAAVASDRERLSICMITLRYLIREAARSGHWGLRFQTDGDRFECLKPDGTWESGEELPSQIGLRITFLDLLVACVGVHPGTAPPFDGRFTVDVPPRQIQVEMRVDWTARGKGIDVQWTVSGEAGWTGGSLD